MYPPIPQSWLVPQLGDLDQMSPKVRTKAAYPSLEESSKWLTEQSKCDGGLELGEYKHKSKPQDSAHARTILMFQTFIRSALSAYAHGNIAWISLKQAAMEVFTKNKSVIPTKNKRARPEDISDSCVEKIAERTSTGLRLMLSHVVRMQRDPDRLRQGLGQISDDE